MPVKGDYSSINQAIESVNNADNNIHPIAVGDWELSHLVPMGEILDNGVVYEKFLIVLHQKLEPLYYSDNEVSDQLMLIERLIRLVLQKSGGSDLVLEK